MAKTSVSDHHTCPYAAAVLHLEQEKLNANTLPPPETTPVDLVTLTKRTCPAFNQTNSCPFKDAKSADDIRQTLLQIPPSHYDPQGPFYQVLQELHQIKGSVLKDTSDDFVLPGGCPVAPVMTMPATPATFEQEFGSFTAAMEQYSLAAIMARLAKQQESRQQQIVRQEEAEETKDGDFDTIEMKVVEHNDLFTTSTESTESTVATTFTTDTAAPTVTLSTCLKQGTAASHQAAEDVHFVRNFIRGQIDRRLYGHLVTMLYHVYTALEDVLQIHAPQHFATCHFPTQLSRRAALEEDMDFWHGTTNLPMSPATRDYVDRLVQVAQSNPLLLLAHSYTRYLGDLSGGRILARVARQAMKLSRDDGLAFYQFDHLGESPKQFKHQYRQALDALPLTSEKISSLVKEANVAFLLNMRLFEELDVMAGVAGARVRPLEEALQFAHHETVLTVQTNKTVPQQPLVQKCPFAKPPSEPSLTITPTVPKSKSCPWPFLLLHDPVKGLGQWQTWVVIGFLLVWMYSRC